MATDLTTIFGTAINVYTQPVQADRQYAGFPGAHGVVCMHLGTRGAQLVISGTLGYSGPNYATARASLQSAINAIQTYTWADAADYTFKGQTFYNVVFDSFQLIPDGTGKAFHWTAEGYVTCKFVCYARILV